jgi:autotransporter adhesin
VGSAGNTRQITNLAAGTADTDAVNVAQLKAVDAIASAGWNAADVDGNKANIGPNGTVTFETGNTNLTVSQTGVDDDGVVEITLADNLDLGTAGSVTTGDTVINNAGVAIGSNVTLGNTGLAIVGGPSVTTVGIDAGGTVITNVAPGVADTDAVNVSQLNDVADIANAGWNATDANGNTANIGPDGTVTFEGDSNVAVTQTGVDDDGVVQIALNRDLDLDSVTTGDTVINNAGVAVGSNVALGNTGLTIVGGPSVTTAGIDAGSKVITNVAIGVAPTDAVNVSQLQDTVSASKTKYYSVNSTGGGNEANDGATGADAIASGKDAEAAGDEAVAMGLGASAAGEGSVAMGAGAQALQLNSLAFGAGAVASHANSIAMGAGSATTVGAQASYTGAYVGNSSSTGEMNVGGRQITGVAAGSAATDAVNVSQLQGGVNTAITESKTYTDTQISNVNTAITNLDNRVTSIEGDIIDIQGDITDIQGDIVDIQGDITDLGDRVAGVEGDVANLTTTVNEFDNRVANVENGADGMFQVSQEGAITKPQPTGTNSSAGGNGASAGGNNALAVGNQSNASGNNSTAIGTGATASAANSTAIGQGATASHANSVALGQGSATTVGAQTNYNAAYVGSSTSTGEVNMGGRTLTGIAPGIAGTDAVNVNQLNGGVNHAINVANQYTDSRITGIQTDVWQMQRDFRGATSSAMAMAGLPQAYLPGKSMVAVGFGGYQGEYGIAFGLSGITENGRYVYKAQASGNTSRDWGFSVGAGLQW